MNEALLDRPWREDAHPVGLVGLAHMTSHFYQMLLPPIFPWLMRDFGIGFAEAGFLATVFYFVSATGQALAGFAVDRLGAFRVLLTGIGVLVLAGLMLGMSQSYAGLIATAALAGAGNAMFHPADYTILNRKVSARRLGHAFAMHGLSGNLGYVAGATFMASVTALAGWQAAGFGAAALAALAWLFLSRQHAVLAGGRPQHRESHANKPANAAPGGPLRFLASPIVWICFAFFFLSTGASGVLQNFAPAMLSHVYDVGVGLGTTALTLYLVGGSAGTLLGGFVAGRQRRSERVVAAALCGAAVLCVLLASGEVPVPLLLPLMFLLGCGSGTAGPSRDLLVRHAATSRFGSGSFGRVYGFVYSGLDTGIAIMPLLVGHLLDGGMFRTGLLCVAGLQIGAVLGALRVGRSA